MTVIMTAVIANLIATNPEQGMAMAFTVVMLAGAMQIIFGLLKIGHYVTMMPYTVIGMTEFRLAIAGRIWKRMRV